MKVAVTGWYGNDNIGDELLARAILDALTETLPSPRLTLLTERTGPFAGYPTCSPLHVSERGVAHKLLRAARHTLRTYGRWARLAWGLDLIVVGGGSLFHDRNPGNLRLWRETLRLYRSLGSSVALYGVTVDPVERQESRDEQASLLRLADVVTVRDHESAHWIGELLGSGRAHLAADPVLNCRLLPASVPVRKRGGRARIGLNLRPLSTVPDSELVRHGASLVRGLLQKFDRGVAFIPMWPGDVTIGLGIAKQLDATDDYSVLAHEPERLEVHVAQYAELDAVIAMRLHTLEVAARCGVPVVGLRYDPKVRSFLDDISLGGFCHHVSEPDGGGWRGLEVSKILDLVNRLLAEWDVVGEHVRSRMTELRRRESNNADTLGAWLRGRGPRTLGRHGLPEKRAGELPEAYAARSRKGE